MSDYSNRIDKVADDCRDREWMSAILDSMDDGIYIVGKDYRIEFMNRSLRNEMGNGEGQLCHIFFGHDQCFCEVCQHGIGSFGPELRREWFCPTNQKTYEIAVTPIHRPNGQISRLHILRDITERKQLEGKLQEYSCELEAKVREQAERLMRHQRLALLGEIAAGLAHEIRTPLGAIITGIKLLDKGKSTEDERRMIISLLHNETSRLERKLSEFLTYAKPRLPQKKVISIGSLFEEIHAVLTTDQKLLGKVVVEVSAEPTVGDCHLDPDQIKEALLNVCINSLQAMQGKGTLRLHARRSKDVLEIFVHDDGPGIAPDDLPHIFKPFYSRRRDGTGLGLAISKEIIESHGGRISVTSIRNLRTTFRITLPKLGETS